MIIKPFEKRDVFAKLRTGITKKGLTTGYAELDAHLKLSKGYMMIVTGVPGAGKSEFVDGVLINASLLHGWKTIYYSPENHPTEQHMCKLAEKYIGKHITSFTPAEIDKALEYLERFFTWMYPDEPDLDTLLTLASNVKDESGLDCIVIDPWNAVNHPRNNAMIHEFLASELTKIIKFTRTKDVLAIIVAHPTKPQKDKDGNYPPINLYDISDGAMWRNRCDYGIVLNRPDMSKNEIELSVQKLKQKFMGCLGSIRMDYDYTTGRFKCKSDHDFSLPHEIVPPF